MAIGRRIDIERVVASIAALGVDKVIVFGSRARGDCDELSDLDLVVIMRTEKRFLDRLKDVYLAVMPDFAMDALVYTPEEYARMLAEGNSLIEMVEREGRVVYERPRG
jgi:predicted nucleotidyltransferase